MDSLIYHLKTIFESSPLIFVLGVGIFVIVALAYNAGQQRTFEQEKENTLVLTLLGGILIFGIIIMITQK